MTVIGPRAKLETVAPGSITSYHLIIIHNDQVVFHEQFEHPEPRLRVCASVLADSDLLSREVITSTRAAQIRKLYENRRNTSHDVHLKEIATVCRAWGVHIYASTTVKKSSAPDALFSVITAYEPDQVDAEHFTSREARRVSLVERVDQFLAAPGCLLDDVVANEQQLAALVAAFLMPATVSLTESVLDAEDGVYRSTGSLRLTQ
ncbi:hypothetical protein [Amycolatopsis sp. CA-230715]|uniref:hypothetical protein n=1 Tax=Amycolatopsis sp. CA-230715 TaxID=2745196 RepID=UPI001C022CF9|nr:hypothetical protein [Amycolatopsis sp. CA-230715]QWF85692.1 hypothetical protein HUW46_09172 [Amycolatopsis sp. CA-230715]